MSQLRALIEGENNLQCWNKAINSFSRVGEYITFDINKEGSYHALCANQMTLFTLNSSRSVYAKINFGSEFFKEYRHGRFNGSFGSASGSALICFELQTKILNSIFRKMERDNSNIARCLLQYSEPSSNDSSTGISKKLEINVVLKSGITKAYRLPCLELDQAYESSFGNENFPNHISCEAKVLKSYMEHMSTKAEEFEMKASESGVSLTSYTIGVSNEAQILKHPLSTRITVGLQEFLTAKLQIGLAIAIRLKELRIMVSFADSLQSRASLTFMFNKPETPMIVEIRGITCTGSMQCFFTFMTQGRYDDGQGPNAERPFLVKEARHRDEGDGYLIPVPPIISVDGDTNNIEREDHISRKNIIVEEDSVRWDNDMEIDVIPQASRAANYKDGGSYEKQHNSSGMDQELVDEEQERDLDLQLASFADELEKRAVGPTQNVSQAKGLFD